MDDLKTLILMVYADWFIILLIVYLCHAPLYFIRKSFPDQKKFFLTMGVGAFGFLMLFYLVLPVPATVQERFISQVHNLKDNNHQASFHNLKLGLNNECGKSYLKGYQYFILLKLYRADMDATFERQKSLSFNGVDQLNQPAEKKVCDLKNSNFF